MKSSDAPIPFFGHAPQRARLAERIDAAVLKVMNHGGFTLGPEMKLLERQLSEFVGCQHFVACGDGTDALLLPLMAWGVGPGDAVFCPAFTFCATAEVVLLAGASPVFVDIDERSYTMSAAHLEASIEMIKAEGKLVPKVVVGVDLFGEPCDWPAIAAVARKHGLKLMADSAQAYGCRLNGKSPIDWVDVAATSFFPHKPLGCYGDGGGIMTNDSELAEVLESIRVHGKASKTDIAGKHFDFDPAKYVNVRLGMNSRLDTLQAAILIEKLAIFPDEIERRNRIAARYTEGLKGHVPFVPNIIEGGLSTWAVYQIESEDRDALASALAEQGIPTQIFYPLPMHMQGPYKHYPVGPGGLPVSESKAKRILGLPMHPYLEDEVVDRIVNAIVAHESKAMTTPANDTERERVAS
jgi:dTDP-4-amino-4,6-dideoxygalactose transaminase